MDDKKRIAEIEREVFQMMNKFFLTGEIDSEKLGELTMEKHRLKKCRLKSRQLTYDGFWTEK